MAAPSSATGLLPSSVVLLTAAAGGRRDIMTATASFVAEDRPLLVVSLARHLLSHELVESAGEFVLNVASRDQAELAAQVGSVHGTEVDKFERFGFATEASEVVSAPRLAEACAALECRVVDSFPASVYTVFVGEVVAAVSDPSLVPLIWLRGRFHELGPATG
jgi:flavin reductase (DIM6/NTAB) family NADH-FMN oxidoreductase RutF